MEGADKSDSPKNICQFYLEDRCRFGSECHNLHEGPIKPISTSKQKKTSSKKSSVNKIKDRPSSPKSMKTAFDVIKRIQWDEMLPAECFTIGYLDRFTGIVEDPFTKFSSWGKIVSLKKVKNAPFCNLTISFRLKLIMMIWQFLSIGLNISNTKEPKFGTRSQG